MTPEVTVSSLRWEGNGPASKLTRLLEQLLDSTAGIHLRAGQEEEEVPHPHLTGQIPLLQKIRSKHLSLHPSHLTHFTAALNGLTSRLYGHDLIMVHACFCVLAPHRNTAESKSKRFLQGRISGDGAQTCYV